MELGVHILGYALVAAFGVALSAEFAGATLQRHAVAKLAAFTVASMLVQLLCLTAFGLKTTYELYPLVVHLPLVAFLATAFRRPWISSAVSVLSAYLCCQIPRWIAETAYLIWDDGLIRNLAHIAALAVTYVLLHRFAVEPMRKLLAQSRQSALLLGVFPLFYYLFDYGSTVYSSLLYSGNAFVVQFMPSLMACAYFLFLLVYASKAEQHESARREQELLSFQLRQSKAEYIALRRMQDQARKYRHDLRHHLSLLQGFAETGDVQSIKEYICGLNGSLDACTPKRYCKNDVVDLLLSGFEGRAHDAGVTLLVEADLPEELPISDIDLCSLVSNGLENAVLAAEQVSGPSRRTVDAKLRFRQKNLLMSIQNPFEGPILFKEGLPVASQEGHGFGTRSIASIAKRYGGYASFSAEDSLFTLRVMLPMRERRAKI